MKSYRSLVDADMHFTFFGLRDIDIPANSVVELSDHEYIAIKSLTPEKILEEVIEPVEAIEPDGAELYEALKQATVKEIKTMLEKRSIEYNNKDIKDVLIQRLMGEVE